jgi:hypothetical protein
MGRSLVRLIASTGLIMPNPACRGTLPRSNVALIHAETGPLFVGAYGGTKSFARSDGGWRG